MCQFSNKRVCFPFVMFICLFICRWRQKSCRHQNFYEADQHLWGVSEFSQHGMCKADNEHCVFFCWGLVENVSSIHLAIQIYMQMKFWFHIDCIQLFCSSINHANYNHSNVNHFNQVRHQTFKIAVTLDDNTHAVSDQAWIGIVRLVGYSKWPTLGAQAHNLKSHWITCYLWFVVFPE